MMTKKLLTMLKLESDETIEEFTKRVVEGLRKKGIKIKK